MEGILHGITLRDRKTNTWIRQQTEVKGHNQDHQDGMDTTFVSAAMRWTIRTAEKPLRLRKTTTWPEIGSGGV